MVQRVLNIKMFVCVDGVSWIVVCLFLSCLTKDIAAQQIKSPAAEFRRHRIVQPVLHHGRTKREITSTRHTEGLHHPEVTMTLNIDGEEHILDLRLNEDLVAGDHTISYQKDGNTVLHKPTIEELDICQYSGTVRGNKKSWVALSTCHGVRGVIHDGRRMRYIEPAQAVDTEIGSKHFIYDHSDLTKDFHCGYGDVTNNTNYDPELMKKHQSDQSRERSRVSRYKREASEDTEVRGPFNVNKQSRYVELVLVADNGEYRANGENIHTVHRQMKDVANIINSVYAPLNIFIALVGVVVWTEQDRIRLEDDGDATLTHFLTYRRETLLNEIPNDNAHLLTRKKFENGVVGKALKGPICTYQYSGGVASNHSEVIGLVATTIAHEMGHNFGMEHDTETDCKCQDEKCIMSPSSTSITPTHWSDCSLRSLALSFERGMDYCLRNKPKRLFDWPTCGNGFVEPGEQCDCGLRADPACAACCDPRACLLRSNATCASGECCDPLVRLFDWPTCGNGFVEPGEQCDCGLRADPACAACCDPRACLLRSNATCASGECCDPLVRLFDWPTCGNGFVEPGEQCDCGLRADPACAACCDPRACLLRSNATCASGECCDPLTCRPKSAGTVCRSAERECDLPEYCTGHSEFCPRDVHKMDATPCSNDQAYCVQGSCRTHSDQCRLLWGSTGSSSDAQCYSTSNVKGDKKGNCGYRRGTERDPAQYHRCAAEDAMCGLLQCRHLNERLEYGMETVATLCAAFINNNGTIIVCRTAMLDMGTQDVDPGMVPDGAKCGENKMCLKQKCVSVSAVRALTARRESSVCPTNCSGHGVCNSEGHCHCDAGFAPPLCALPGPGGSIDSGPATDSSIQRNFMVAMYIIFLGILPSILLVLFLLYYSRHNVLLWWKKPRKTVQSPKKNSLQRRLSRSASKFAANFQNNTQNNAQPVNVHTLSNPDDMSSSLLRSDSEHSPSGNLNPSVNFFGNFKGFSLTPIDKNLPQNEKEDSKGKKSETAPKSAKITPVHRSGSNSQNIGQALKPVMRSAPPLPVVPITTKPTSNTSPSVKRTNSSVQNRIKALIGSDKPEEDPITNPAPRPVISSPILEASTCTAKELISPLQGSKTMGPIRQAPTVPTFSPEVPKRPLSMHSAGNVPQKPLPEEPKKVKEGISLNRIASFLKQEKPKEKERNPVERSHSLPKNPNNQVKVLKTTDKAALRNLQISNPILQKDIELSVNTVPVVSDSEDGDDSKAFVNRAQSMRAPLAQKPAIQSFGSMRQAPGVPRPLSCVGRPTAPPPPLPNQSKVSEDPTIYQKPKAQNEIKSTDYVDCIEEKPVPLAHIDEESGDNIYAIIEESPEHHFKPFPKSLPSNKSNVPPKVIQPPTEEYKTPKPINSNSGSTESMGLLGEIVNEIQNRNFDSIYSANTLSRKKEKEKKNSENKRDSTYMNADYKTPESVYSNSGTKSSAASTTSSGYLHPSAVNVPTYMQKEDSKQETEKANSKIPTFTRQITPPGLRSTSTFKSVPQSPKTVPKSLKTIPNSPDLVSSCTVPDTKNVKAPDVINNNKVEPPKVATKPSAIVKNDNRPPLRPAPNVEKKTVKSGLALKPANLHTNVNKTDKNPPLNRANSKTDSNVKAIADNLNKNRPKIVPKPSTIVQKTDTNVKPNTTKLAAKPSNVANLQQKFENRKSLGKEIAAKK